MFYTVENTNAQIEMQKKRNNELKYGNCYFYHVTLMRSTRCLVKTLFDTSKR